MKRRLRAHLRQDDSFGLQIKSDVVIVRGVLKEYRSLREHQDTDAHAQAFPSTDIFHLSLEEYSSATKSKTNDGAPIITYHPIIPSHHHSSIPKRSSSSFASTTGTSCARDANTNASAAAASATSLSWHSRREIGRTPRETHSCVQNKS